MMLINAGFAQNPLLQATPNAAPKEVSVLESRFSTTMPVINETFQYFLKFDYQQGIAVSPVEHFSEHGIRVNEVQRLDPQEFQGRIIQQYTYSLSANQKGDQQFVPVSLNYLGPRQQATAAEPEPAQLTVTSFVEAKIVTNSPILLNEPLELQVVVTKHKPVTITAMPQELQATQQIPPQPEFAKQPAAQVSATPASSPPPQPQPEMLRFTLDRAQQITPQQQNGQTVEQYAYVLAASPQQAGEYVIPETTMTYRTDSGETTQETIEAAHIFVMNPSVGNRDVPTDYRFLILPAIIAAIVLVTAFAVIVYLKYRKPRVRNEITAAPPLPPGDVARQELAQIQAMNLPQHGEFKQYYILISESVRKFLGAEYQFHVLERTTEEILDDIQRRHISESIRRRIRTFLPEADMVKFAQYIPTVPEADFAMEQAVNIVDDTLENHAKIGNAPETSPTSDIVESA